MQQPNFSLAGRVAAVTGASRGIGRSIAAAFAGAGATVALMGRDAHALDGVHRELAAAGFETAVFCVDVDDPRGIEAGFDAVSAAWGRLDILVNNAGIEQVCPSTEVPEDLWDRIVRTNLKGAFFCAQAAARRMRAGGAILNVCSLASEVGIPGAAAYGASKSGLAGLTHTLAAEWAALGIRVNGLGPGYFETALTAKFFADAAWQQRMLDKIPLRRFGLPHDLTGAAIFLCSEAAAYVTGQILYVDGGYLASV